MDTRTEPNAELEPDEVRVLQLLGAGALELWTRLPREIQRDLFRATLGHSVAPDATAVRGALARFIHDHKDDGAASP